MNKNHILVSLLLGSFPFSAFAVMFGNPGMDGRNGNSGENGKNGQNVEVQVNNSSQEINISGQDGQNGSSGERGGEATNCYQPYNVPYNVFGANGGKGGDAGNGGDGGNGGFATLFYQDLNAVKKIKLISKAGKKGVTGSAGSGGYACTCSVPYWNVNGYTYACYPGSSSQGRTAQDGKAGEKGKLRLVKGKTIPVEQAAVTQLFTEFLNSTQNYSKNIWETKEGALSMLAPGSDVDTKYEFFIKNVQRNLKINWLSSEPAYNQRVSIAFDGQKFDIPHRSMLWKTTSTLENNLYTLNIHKVFYEQDILKFKYENILGEGEDLTVKISDNAEITDTEIKTLLRYMADDPRTGHYPDEQGNIPEEFVERDGKFITIYLGKFIKNKSLTEKGFDLKLVIECFRMLDDQYLRQWLIKKFKVGETIEDFE